MNMFSNFGKFKRLAYQFRKRDIFEQVFQHDDIKWLLTSALDSEQPVHILLVGPPGIGKTRFLKAIEAVHKCRHH